MRLLLPFLACFTTAVAISAPHPDISDGTITGLQNPATLSAFGFFDGNAAKPSGKLISYRLRTPLFSDYAEKQRFIYLPPDTEVTADTDGRLVFPVGSALVKNFGFTDPETGLLKVLETRLLLHKSNGWVALPYVWRTDGSDADLRVGGTRIPVNFERGGKTLSISYAVPNKNQCKQCHSSSEQIIPIGPIWQNMEFPQTRDARRFAKANPQLAKLDKWAAWDDARSGDVGARARNYLKVNCGHCHAPKGAASNSGLFLDGSTADATALGIGKRPVAAGRASGDLDFIIEAGHPERSILIARMKSTDAGIAMPELGRSLNHQEGIKLLEGWIAAMPPSVH